MKIKLLGLAAIIMMLGVACSNNTTPPPSNGCPQDPSISISCGGKNYCAAACVSLCGGSFTLLPGSCSCSGQVSGDEVNGKYCQL